MKTNAQEIQFARVDRIGRKTRDKIRPIVAKFERYKEREILRDAFFAQPNEVKKKNEESGKTRKSTNWYSRTILCRDPAEEEEINSQDERRQEKREKVKLVRDQLYIYGQLFKENQDAEDMNTN